MYWSGLCRLAEQLRGDEKVHLTFRPYGFHAGNALSMVAYPLLLAEQVAKRGVEPRFQITIVLNDWEPTDLVYPDGEEFVNNIAPLHTTFQFTKDPANCCPSVVAHWERVVLARTKRIVERFPEVYVATVRNSDLKTHAEVTNVFRQLLKDPRTMAELLAHGTGGYVNPATLQFAGAVCPSCKSARGVTRVCDSTPTSLLVGFDCHGCGASIQGAFPELDFWCYYAPLRVAMTAALSPDLRISGGDKVASGDVQSAALIHYALARHVPVPRMLVSPILLGLDGHKMSKSKQNSWDSTIDRLLNAASGCDSSSLAGAWSLAPNN
jgi:hypothetical protein